MRQVMATEDKVRAVHHQHSVATRGFNQVLVATVLDRVLAAVSSVHKQQATARGRESAYGPTPHPRASVTYGYTLYVTMQALAEGLAILAFNDRLAFALSTGTILVRPEDSGACGGAAAATAHATASSAAEPAALTGKGRGGGGAKEGTNELELLRAQLASGRQARAARGRGGGGGGG